MLQVFVVILVVFVSEFLLLMVVGLFICNSCHLSFRNYVLQSSVFIVSVTWVLVYLLLFMCVTFVFFPMQGVHFVVFHR